MISYSEKNISITDKNSIPNVQVQEVRTRFAPSPTGTLHIGSVRTILFNYLYAKAKNGKFLLRIEDTDIERSKEEFVDNIFQTLENLGLQYDEEPIYQKSNFERHRKVAYELLNQGKAYKCYCSEEELIKERDLAIQNKQTPKYNRKCRNLKEELDKPFTIRLKTDLEGLTEFTDLIQGNCSVKNENMDDMILLRSNSIPTYMFAVVVDDHDMNITHVIRGTEHLNNAYRQLQIYKACNFPAPYFAHVSLIHGEDGAKLSKRNGAKSVEEYQKEGFLKEAILNYLLRLGWSYGEEEIISIAECVKIFDICNVRSSAARFSLDKLLSMNAIYIRSTENQKLLELLKKFNNDTNQYSKSGWNRILNGLDELKKRSRTLKELLEMSHIYGYESDYYGEINYSENIEKLVHYSKNNSWPTENYEEWLKNFLDQEKIKLKDIAPDLRFALTKSKVSPNIYDLMQVLGKNIFQERLKKANYK